MPKDVYVFCHQQIKEHLEREKEAEEIKSSTVVETFGRVTAEERLTVQITKRRDEFKVDKGKALPQVIFTQKFGTIPKSVDMSFRF